MTVECTTRETGRLMADTDRLQRHRRDSTPVWGDVHLLLKPLGVVQVPLQSRLQTADALLADQEPELQCAKPPAEGNAPVAEIDGLAVGARLQIAGIGRHHANQVLRVADEVRRAIENRA